MDFIEIRKCLALLREADAILLARGEHAIGVHLSLVIDKLAARLPEEERGDDAPGWDDRASHGG